MALEPLLDQDPAPGLAEVAADEARRALRPGPRLRSSQTITPLPAARPSALITTEPPDSAIAAWAAATVSHTVARAVGTPAVCMTVLAKALELSSRAAAAVGPKHGEARIGDPVGEPCCERRLGTDHDQVRCEVRGDLGDALEVGQRHGVQGRRAGRCPGSPALRAARSAAATAPASRRARARVRLIRPGALALHRVYIAAHRGMGLRFVYVMPDRRCDAPEAPASRAAGPACSPRRDASAGSGAP